AADPIVLSETTQLSYSTCFGQSMLYGPGDNLRPRAKAEAIEHTLEVVLRRALTDDHRFSNLAIRQSAGDKRDDFSLARRERRKCFGSEKAAYPGEQGFGFAEIRQVDPAMEWREDSTRNIRRDFATELEGHRTVLLPVEDKCGNRQRWKDL